jgi:hypothetical protein
MINTHHMSWIIFVSAPNIKLSEHEAWYTDQLDRPYDAIVLADYDKHKKFVRTNVALDRNIANVRRIL